MSEHIKKPPSQRQLKVGEEIRHILSEIFVREEFYDHMTRQTLSVTVSEVSVSPDLRNATIYVMPLAGRDKERTKETLVKITPRLRSLVSRKMQLRHVPEFFFKLDDVFDHASSLDTLLNRPDVRRDIEKKSEIEEF